jgi:hypothetical protein
LIISLFVAIVCAQGQSKRKPTPQQVQDATNIESRMGNGIFVDSPKVYDDSSLQLMLNSARARLATIQAIDQTGLLSRIGAVTGASLNQSSVGVTFTGPPIPGSVVTANAPTGSTAVNTANGGSTLTTTNLPAQGTVTTNPQQNASVPAPPANGGVTLPTSYSVSALDALSEQMQLTYEIANLQLLLEGSLNDRYVKNMRYVKPRTTLGFPITISSLAPFKNAIAVVEVEVVNADRNFEPKDKPAVTALLPREKTYNVAALTDNMTSIGGGLVTQVINGGFSFLKGRKSYYIVQDQDTLASLIAPDPASPNATAFSWQFRPVLGQSFVRPGMKQTFVQLSAPLEAAANCFGRIKVKTYWRRIDRKTGVLKEIIPESISDATYVEPEIPIFDLTPLVQDVNYDDVGNGQIRVSVDGSFLGGTYIRVGNNSYREGSPGFVSELTRIQFVASAMDVAKHKAYIVSRDGSETEIINPLGAPERPKRVDTCFSLPTAAQGFQLKVPIREVTVSAGSKTKFPVTVTAPGTISPTVTLSASAYPAPTGALTGWTTGTLTPAAAQSLGSGFVLDTLAATVLGNYTVQIQANAGAYPSQSINITLHVIAAVPKPTLTAAITSFDDSKSIVTATLTNEPAAPGSENYLMVINERVFGLSDAPIERDTASHTYRAVVPTSLVSGPTTVTVKPLFWDESYATTPSVLTTKLESTIDKVVVLDRSGDPVQFLLYGNRLAPSVIKFPTGVSLNALGGNDPATIGVFSLTKAQWGATKQIVLQKSANERPVFVAIPTLEPPPKITLTAGGRVVVGTDELVVTGDTFDNLKSVLFNKTAISKVIGGKSVKLTGLVAARVTSIAGEPELQFEFDDGKKNTLKLDVVNSKIETVPRP